MAVSQPNVVEIDVEDPDAVFEFAHAALKSRDEAALFRLFDLASKRLSTQSIVNVLIATTWLSQKDLNCIIGWRGLDPSTALKARRAAYLAYASGWLDVNAPHEKAGLIDGLGLG